MRLRYLIALLFLASVSSAQTTSGRMLDTVYDKLIAHYADKPDTARLIRKGIDGMMGSLDPWTYFMDANEANDFTLSMKARFGGTGVVISRIRDSIIITEVFKNKPADKAGVRPGDILLDVDTVSLDGMPLDNVFPLLRGKPGTQVRLIVLRPSTNKITMFSCIREEIKISSVPFYGMVADHIGYIKLTGETDSCSEDVKKGLLELKKDPLLKGLILDLRGNQGGYMREALRIANLFIEKGKPAVSERSWREDTTSYFMNDPVDTELPLVVLIDSMTVSSGEILSGALQDHDRAVFIGEKTFGKGMVQELFHLSTGEIVRITTAYYHTPSGRCIQRKDYSTKKEGVVVADSAKKYFTTAHGRKVIDHDGIWPDIKMEIEDPPAFINDLSDPYTDNGRLLLEFVLQYVSEHPSIGPGAKFRLSDAGYNQFVKFIKEKGFRYSGATEQKFKELEEVLSVEKYNKDLAAQLTSFRAGLQKEKEKLFSLHRNEIKELLEREIVSRYYYRSGGVENSLKDDAIIKKAIAVLNDKAWYKRIVGL